jgi:hypothetical protein
MPRAATHNAEPHQTATSDHSATGSWAIHKDGQSEPLRRSTRLYRSAEDAWTAGRAVLGSLPRFFDRPVVTPADQNANPNMRLL